MTVSDHVRPVENGKTHASSGFQSELHTLWGPPPALKQAGEFLSGVGEGFGLAINEGVKAVAQAVSNPGEAVHKAVTETGKTVAGVLSATEAAGEYVGDHASRADWKSVVEDAHKTSHAIEHVLTTGIEHVAKMNAHDLGKVIGHDVLPGAIAAVAAPELAGESLALAASAASKIGTIAKEGAVLERVAGAYEATTSKIAAISEKMAGLNKKMDNLLHKEESVVHAMEGGSGPRLRSGELPALREASNEFKAKVQEIELSPGEKRFLRANNVQIDTVHNMGSTLGHEHAFQLGTYQDGMNIIRIGETTGFEGDLAVNNDIAHTLHHEIGHAVNYWFGDRSSRPFQYVLDLSHFKAQFEADLAKNTDAAITARKTLEHLFPNNPKAQMDEAFALMFGHVSCPSNNQYAKDMRKAFEGYYKLVENFRKENGI